MLLNCDHPGRPARSRGGAQGHLGVPVGGHCVSTWFSPVNFLPLPRPWQCFPPLLPPPVSIMRGFQVTVNLIFSPSPRTSRADSVGESLQLQPNLTSHTLEKVAASVSFPRSLSLVTTSLPSWKSLPSPSCIPFAFCQPCHSTLLLIAPHFRLISYLLCLLGCANTRAPRSWARGWPQFPCGSLPRPQAQGTRSSHDVGRGAEGRGRLGAAAGELGGRCAVGCLCHGGRRAGVVVLRVPHPVRTSAGRASSHS